MGDTPIHEVVAVFAGLGWRAFGGPAAHVALMEREIVRKRRWLAADQFRRLFGACNLMPGPGSTQLALLLGLRRAGLAGMLTSAVLFIGPAVLVMLGLGELYLHFGSLRVVAALLLGVEAAVVAIVARAVIDLSHQLWSRWVSLATAVAAFAAGLASVSPLAVMAGGAAIAVAAGSLARATGAGLPGKGAGVGNLLMIAASAGQGIGGSILLSLALGFAKIGAVAFGSGYVLLPFLHADLVGTTFGLTDHQLADAFALSQATPGPIFGLAAFLGVQVAGIPGGLIAALAIFLPSFFYVPLIDVAVRVIERYPSVRAGLDGVIAAVVGLIGAVCVVLGRAAFTNTIQVVGALIAFAILCWRPTAQPVAILVGAAAGGVSLL